VVKLSPNKRRTGRTRKKERGQSEAELKDAGPESKVPAPEVERPQAMERDPDKTESELKSSEPETIWPQHVKGERQPVEHSQAEPAKKSQQAAVKAQAGQQSGGKRVADNREGAFDSFTKMSESVFSLEGMKKAAAWYIETSEKLANQALELQEKATGWAKDTPFASLFEAQHSIARKFVERSANAARTLWQIPSDQ